MSINWNNLRVWDGSQRTAFEELCCQLAEYEQPPSGSKFFRKGVPDAGVECYRALGGGDEWGWQAKFFLSPPGQSEWRQIDDSVTTAIEKHRRLIRYFVCLPIDRPDPRIPNQGSFMDKWHEHVDKWRSWALEKGMAVEFEYWGAHEIFTRLCREEHRGRHQFWFNKDSFSRSWFEEKVGETIANAGPRYTPELNIDLPIAGLFKGLGRAVRFFIDIKVLRGHIVRGFAKLRRATSELTGRLDFRTLFDGIERLCKLLAQAEQADVDQIDLYSLVTSASKARELAFDCERSLRATEKSSRETQGAANNENCSAAVKENNRHRDLGYVYHHLSEISGKFTEVIELFDSKAARAANVGALLLIGEAGTGKTHLFCDVAKQRASEGLPTLLLLGQHFSPEEPWSQIAKLLGLQCGKEELLGALEAAAQAVGGRALILIDGLNEGEGRNLWRNYLAGLLTTVRRFPRIGIALSVRSSYTDMVVPPGLAEDKLVTETHHGFADYEYEAARTFFDHFGIERPAVPLLSPEFQNPLFLKLFCQGLKNRRLTRIPPGLHGISSIFEFFLDSVNDKLAQPQYLDYDKNEKLAQKAVEKFSEALADRTDSWLPREEARTLVESLLPREGHEKSLFRHLMSEGVFAANRFRSGPGSGSVEEVRFSYDRLTDHCAAKVLLDRHLDVNDPASSFSLDGPLGRFVKDETTTWMKSGIIEALCVELPERVGKELPEVAPSCADFRPVRKAFVLSLIFRDPKATGKGTLSYINNHVMRYRDTRDEFLDALLTVASVPEHPYNADFLSQHLMRFSLADRDAWWSIYLHRQYGQRGAVDRLVEWAWSPEDKAHIQGEAVRLAAVALAWFLTTSNRYLRDRATKALVALLTLRIGVLRQVLAMFLEVNDPYVLERLCAVGYGCAMRSQEKSQVAALAKDMFTWFFENKCPPPDILLRDYARGVIEVALNSGVDIGIDRTAASPPYRSEWPKKIPSRKELEKYDRWSEGMPETKRARLCLYDSVMGSGDFARYIIGTNSGMFHWSSRRLGARRRPSGRERYERCIESLSPKQKRLWEIYSNLRSEISFAKFRQKLGFKDDVQAVDRDRADERAQEALSAAEVAFGKSLRKSQRAGYVKYVRSYLEHPSSPEEEYRFDLSIAQRWIFKKVLALGWTPERFGEFDIAANRYSYRESRKPERMGKKYQWIAYREFLARVADNFEFRPEAWSERSEPYEGPWQAYIRDIDPSCLTVKTKRQEWQPHSDTWWFPSHYDTWDLESDDVAWVKSSTDLPMAEPLLEVIRPEDGRKWLVMEAFYNWEQPTPPEEERYEIPRRRIWYMLRSYVVKKDDIQTVFKWASAQNFMGRWMPESKDIYRVFLGEFHWAPAYLYHNRDYYGQPGWTRGENNQLPVQMLPTTNLYTHEGTGYDCSIDETIHIYLPCKWLSDKIGLRRNGIEGRYFNQSGELMAFDPSVDEAGPGGLLMRKDGLLEFLDKAGYSVFWTLLGEKDVVGGLHDITEWKGRLTINGALMFQNGAVRRISKTRFEGPK